MMRQMRETSLEAYIEMKEEKKGTRREIIYETIKRLNSQGIYPTDRELQEIYLHWKEPNMVRPRRKELEDMGMIAPAGKRKCLVSGRSAYTWVVVK